MQQKCQLLYGKTFEGENFHGWNRKGSLKTFAVAAYLSIINAYG